MAQKLPRRNLKMLRVRLKPREGFWIVYQLRLKGIKQVDLCRKLGVRSSTMTKVIHGRTRSGRIEEALCQALGYPSFEDMIAAARGKGAV